MPAIFPHLSGTHLTLNPVSSDTDLGACYEEHAGPAGVVKGPQDRIQSTAKAVAGLLATGLQAAPCTAATPIAAGPGDRELALWQS